MNQITKTNMLWIFVLAVIMPISLNAACIEGGSCNGDSDCCKPTTPPLNPAPLPNLALVTWAHAVNSEAHLTDVLKNNGIKMIEADVVMGTVVVQPSTEKPETSSTATVARQADTGTGNENPTNNQPTNNQPTGNESGKPATEKPTQKPTQKPTEPQVPIMSHPPSQTSDLSFVKFVDMVVKYNAHAKEVKGVKLDFKTIEAVTKALPLIKENELNLSPVWINADILAGPGGSATPVDAKAFFEAVKAELILKKSTLSIGWTTGVDPENTQYTDTNVEEMLKVIRENIKSDEDKLHSITFPVRAAIAAQSQGVLDKLVTEVEKMKIATTLTIWTAQDDKVDVKKLKDLINHFGNHKVYVDVDDNLKASLAKPNSASSLVNFGLLNVVTFLFALFLRNGF